MKSQMQQQRAEYIAYIKSLVSDFRVSIKNLESDISDSFEKLEHAKEYKLKGYKRVIKADIRFLRKRLKRERQNLKDAQTLLFIAESTSF